VSRATATLAARLGLALLVALLAAAWVAGGAAASAAVPPLTGLGQARSEVSALLGQAGSAAVQNELRAARGDLTGATASWLWIDPAHLIAPEHGGLVFADSRAALSALERIPAGSVPAAGVSGTETSILGADRALAELSIRQALRGTGGLLSRAEGMILSGDRWAQTSRLDLAAEQYGAGWRDAFLALTGLVVSRLTFVSPELGRAAENALQGGRQTRPAGVHAVHGQPGLERAGKPEVLFVGAESCAACAIERWGLVVALSRFGVFSNLQLGQSAVDETPFVRSVTFVGARYLSPYVSFVPIELSSDAPAPGRDFRVLGRLTRAQRSLFRALDPRAIAPFIDVANRFADVGAASPALADGLSWSALAGVANQPHLAAGQAIAASAEVLTAEICRATGGMPAPVCGSPVVQDYSSRLARFGGLGSGCVVVPGPVAVGVVAAGVARRADEAARRAVA
jgi:hypothetical protein